MVADDHNMFVEGIEMLIHGQENIAVIAKAYNGKEVLDILENTEIDIVLLDLDMPLLNGEEATSIIKERFPKTKVIILTMHDEPSFIRNLVALQVDGYLLKNTPREGLFAAIKKVYNGGSYFGQGLLQSAVRQVFEEEEREAKTVNLLSEREIEIVKLTAKDFTLQDIADKLSISVNTVKSHRKNIQKKIDVKTSLGIVKYAVDNNLI